MFLNISEGTHRIENVRERFMEKNLPANNFKRKKKDFFELKQTQTTTRFILSKFKGQSSKFRYLTLTSSHA